MYITIVLKEKRTRENKGAIKHNKILTKVKGVISRVVKLFSVLMVCEIRLSFIK